MNSSPRRAAAGAEAGWGVLDWFGGRGVGERRAVGQMMSANSFSTLWKYRQPTRNSPIAAADETATAGHGIGPPSTEARKPWIRAVIGFAHPHAGPLSNETRA